MSRVSSPLYDSQKTFEENFSDPLFPPITSFSRQWPPRAQWVRFLDYSLASRIGAAPCAVTTGKGISLLARLGFDVLTYKTIRRRAYPSHPLPNIVYVDEGPLCSEADLAEAIYVRDQPVSLEKIAISNSFGNGCLAPELVTRDIALAKNSLSEGQVLIVSIYGEGETPAALAGDFSAAALLAQQAGADIIELNLSCPNLLKPGEPIYQNAELVFKIAKAVIAHVGDIPVLLKIGLLSDLYVTGELLLASARAGVSGISAINSVSMRVLDQKQQPVFGKRVFSGVSGYPIRELALKFVRQLVAINQEQKLNLAILGMGGITLPEHFNEYLNAGADIALSATGMMWNPQLALQYYQKMGTCLH